MRGSGGTDKKLRDTLVALKQSTREGLPAALQQAIHQLATSPRQDVVEALRAIQLGMATSADLVAAVVQVMPNDPLDFALADVKAIARAAMPTVNVATVAQAAGLAPTLVAELATHGLGLESAAQVRVALGQDTRLTTFAPRSVLLREALMVELTQEPVTTRELGEDLEVFTDKVLVRPDGDVVDALSGKSLGKAGELREQDGEWLAGELVVGALYGMRAGNVVALDDDDAATGEVLWEPGLAHSVADILLDGIADGVIAQALGFAQTVTFPCAL